jgi:hypothetical protein
MENVDATVRRMESLLDELGAADPQVRTRAEELIRLLMQLYGAGLARAIEILGSDAAARLAEDKLLGSILLLHDLHPVDARTRIAEALHRIERRLDGHRVYLADLCEGRAIIRVELHGGVRPSGLVTAIERAIAESAPEVEVSIEGLPEPVPALVQIAMPNAPEVAG